METYEVCLSGLCKLLLGGGTDLGVWKSISNLILCPLSRDMARRTYQARACPRGPG